MTHEQFEKRLMEMLLAGDDPVLDGLRNQYLTSSIESTKFTGVGFFTNFKVKEDDGAVAGGLNFHFGDVDAFTFELDIAYGFVLFVKNGLLDFLEGYTLLPNIIWPSDYFDVLLKYDGLNGKRDLEKLKKIWASS